MAVAAAVVVVVVVSSEASAVIAPPCTAAEDDGGLDGGVMDGAATADALAGSDTSSDASVTRSGADGSGCLALRIPNACASMDAALAVSSELSETSIDGSGTAPLTNSATAAANPTAPLSRANIPKVGPPNRGRGGSGIVTCSSDGGRQLMRAASSIASTHVERQKTTCIQRDDRPSEGNA
jgi:hypothetical protein